MAYTFETVWRKVLLHAPDVPVFLAREFVQQVFSHLADRRPWTWLRKELWLQTRASRTLTVAVVNGSLAVTSAALFVASDAGRQFRVGGLPTYTIATVTDASNAVLLQPYLGTTGSATATILDAYLTLPVDFGRFLSIVDPSAQRQVPFWLTEEALDWVDPHRTNSGDARVLVSHGLSTLPATLGQLQYAWWPAPSAARTYPALYFTRPPTLTDTQVLPGVFAQRGDVLVTGALAECAAWPGTSAKPNAYFNLNTHRLKKAECDAEALTLMLRDDDQAPMDLPPIWRTYADWPAYDTIDLRASDATVGAYY